MAIKTKVLSCRCKLADDLGQQHCLVSSDVSSVARETITLALIKLLQEGKGERKWEQEASVLGILLEVW